MTDIAAWLEQLGLAKYAPIFSENEVELADLSELSEDDLTEIGLPLGPRRRILKAVRALDAGDRVPKESTGDDAADAHTRVEAERRQLTVMFCDLVGSTELSARLDPEDLREVIRSYQDALTGEITRFDGHVAKFMGDGVLAYFGWPIAHEDDAERAVRSGIAVAEGIGRLATPTGEPLQVRVGIATGLVVVGDLIGEGAAQEEAVVGATPNLAARLQGMAAGNTVVIADSTRALLGEQFVYEDLGPQELRGFSEQVHAWRVVRLAEAGSRFEAIRGPRLTPLVGRKEELDLLGRRWAQAKEGEGQVVLLTGEAGIGKSRIAHSLHEQITKEPHVRLLYQCSPYHTNSALYPFIRQLERAARLEREDTDQQRLDKLEALLAQSTRRVPEVAALIAALLSIASGTRYPPLVMSPQKQKEDTLRVLLEQLEGLAERQAALLVFEDVHWLDPTSQELLDLIVERVEGLPVLVLITFRPEYIPPWSDQAHVTLLALNRLSRDLGAAMVRALSGRKALPQEVLEQVVNKTDGIPLFVEELTKTVLDSALLVEKRDRYALAGQLPEHAIPTSLKDSLMARLDQLAHVKEVAQTGAVIGREFSHQLLAKVSDLSDHDLDDALERLSRSELVFRRGAPPNASYLFKHALVQDAAYESLLKARRRHLHARIAQVIESQFPERTEVEPELLAHHYTEAGLVEQAVTYWQRAGERAVVRSAHAEAIGHLNNGLTVLKGLPDSPERTQHELLLQSTLGPPLIATKGYGAPEVERVYTRARELCRDVGDTPQLCSILYGLWAFYGTRAEYKKNRALADELLTLAERTRDPVLILDGHVALAATSFFVGEFGSAQAYGARGMALYDPDRHRTHALQNPGVNCEIYHAMALWFLGYPDQALARSHEMLDHARELAHPFSSAGVLTWLAKLHHCLRRAQEAQAFAEEAVAIASDQGYPSWLSVACWVRGWAMAEQGRTEEGLAQVQEGVAIRKDEGANLWRPYQLSLLAEAHGKAGQVEEAKQLLTEALTVAEKTGERYWEAELHRLKGLLLAGSRNDATEAEACFGKAIEVARQQTAKSLELRAATSLARLWHHQGKRKEARDLLAPIYNWFTEGFDTVDWRDAKAVLEELTG